MAEPLVGRASEFAALVGLLGGVASGRGRGVVLLGDAGIGKTTLAAAFAAEAQVAGFLVGWGRCPETETTPYWPWRQALRDVDPKMPLSDVAPAGRPSVFADVAERLARATAERPALAILEDVHLADGPSLALLRFVAGVLPELRCVLLLTSRDNAVDVTPAAAEALDALPPSFVRLALGGLDRAETAELVGQVLGAPQSDIADTVFERSGGNPFFVQELARLHAARGVSGLGPPAGVRQVVGRRLARLHQRTHDCLTAAAVLGDEVDVTVLADVAGAPAADVVDQLREAVDARLVGIDGPRLRFAHTLVREVLYDATGAGQRSELHLRAAEVLVGRCCTRGVHTHRYGLPLAPCCSAERIEASAGVVAGHFRRAIAKPGAAELAREHALVAARTAMRRAGYEQAVHYYRWATDDADADPAVQLELGEALVLAGQMSDGRATLRGVARNCLTVGDGETAARAVLAMGGGIGGFEVDLDDADQILLLNRALVLLPEGDSVVKAAAVARSSIGQVHGRMDAASRELAAGAVDMARRLGDVRTEAAAIAAWCDTASGPDFVSERVAEARRMLGLAERHGDLTLVLLARRLLVVGLLELGEFDAADEQISAYARIADLVRVPFYSWPVPVWRGMRALMRGDLAVAEGYIAEAKDLAATAQSTNAALMTMALQLGVADATGRWADNPDLIEQTFSGHWESPMAQAYLAYFLLKAGDEERAAAMLAQRIAHGVEAIAKDAEWLTCVALLGEAARLLNHRAGVEICVAALRPYAHLWLFDGIGGACYGQVADRLAQFDAFLGGSQRPPATQPQTGELRHDGASWALCWRDEWATVPDAKGIRDLAMLLTRPRTAVHVLDLVGSDLRVVEGGTPILDGQARAAYTARLRELADDIAEAEQFADAGKLERLRAEHDFIAHELSSALGFGGRVRMAGDPVERARKAVSMRITAAIKSIEQAHPALGRHLRASVRTGRHCVYEPEDEVTWHS